MRNGIGLRRSGKHNLTDPGDWRQAIWNRWLISYLTPRDDERSDREATVGSTGEAPPREAQTSPSAFEGPVAPSAVAGGPITAGPVVTETGTPEKPTPTEGKMADPTVSAETDTAGDSAFPIRPSARARFDALIEHVYSLEGTIDALMQRSQRTGAQERLEVRRITEGLDRMAELQERHTDALLSCTRALERLERRMMSLERHALSRPWVDPRPPLGTFHSEPPRMPDPDFREMLTPSGRPRAPVSGTRLASDSGQAFQGNLGDLSVPTLLSMFELEHRTGSFEIETDDQVLLVQLAGGKLVGVIQNGIEADPVDALASVIEQRQGRFMFTPSQGPLAPADKTVSIGSVLLRVSQKNDEDNRVLFATS
jgi:hypothetical protein